MVKGPLNQQISNLRLTIDGRSIGMLLGAHTLNAKSFTV